MMLSTLHQKHTLAEFNFQGQSTFPVAPAAAQTHLAAPKPRTTGASKAGSSRNPATLGQATTTQALPQSNTSINSPNQNHLTSSQER
jgi:hypothetical protein